MKHVSPIIACSLLLALSSITQRVNALYPSTLTINNNSSYQVTFDYADPSDEGFNLSIEINPNMSKTIEQVNDRKNVIITLHRVPLSEDETTSVDIPAAVYSLAREDGPQEATLRVESTLSQDSSLQQITAQLVDNNDAPQGEVKKWTYLASGEEVVDANDDLAAVAEENTTEETSISEEPSTEDILHEQEETVAPEVVDTTEYIEAVPNRDNLLNRWKSLKSWSRSRNN